MILYKKKKKKKKNPAGRGIEFAGCRPAEW